LARRVSRTELRVRYHETDPMRVAWHGNYIAWFEIARTNWLREQGLSYRELEEGGVFLPVLHVECDYRQAARYDDVVVIEAKLIRYNGLRLAFGYTVQAVENERLLATGHTEHTFTNHNLHPIRPERGMIEVHRLLLEGLCE